MADINITNGLNIDLTKWKRMTPQEILREQQNGNEIPPEIIAWAQQMVVFANMPDNVTYDMVDGDVGLEALEKLGLENPFDNAEKPTETETDDAVKDVDKPEDTDETENNNPEFSLANPALIADNDEIRKRKERKGII